MKRMVALALVVMLLGVGAASAATISIPLGTVIRADEGSVTLITEQVTPDGLAGQVCNVDVEADNNSSVHPDNDVIVDSANTVTVFDVEAAPGTVIPADGLLTLGDTITVSLRMGSDRVFSADGLLVLNCSPPKTTTSTTTSTTSTTTTVPDTTTSFHVDTCVELGGCVTTTVPTTTTTTIPRTPDPDPKPCDFDRTNDVRDCDFTG